MLRETSKALLYLHQNHVMHRDVRGSNILITAGGEVKLCDFGLTHNLKSESGRCSMLIGSPSWMAPEMFTAGKVRAYEPDEYADEDEETEARMSGYDYRSDVWALGITAIELGDGAAPFLDMHPSRTMFQVVRNPPPTLYRPANWSKNYNDFISE